MSEQQRQRAAAFAAQCRARAADLVEAARYYRGPYPEDAMRQARAAGRLLAIARKAEDEYP